jgi:hypothetical protein
MNTKSKYIGYLVLLLLVGTLYAFAQSDTSTTPKTSTGAGGVVIAYLICNSRKRYAIGGWLLYFYMQLFGGALISFGVFFTILKNFNAELWDDRALYTLYLLSIIPAYVATFAELTVGSLLISKRFRNPQTVNWLRITFVGSFVFALIGLLIDSAHWPESVAFDFFPLIGSALWFLYFTRSKRVDLVFRQANWDPNVMYPLPPGTTEPKGVSKRWLKIYAIVIVAIIAAMFLLIFLTSKN